MSRIIKTREVAEESGQPSEPERDMAKHRTGDEVGKDTEQYPKGFGVSKDTAAKGPSLVTDEDLGNPVKDTAEGPDIITRDASCGTEMEIVEKEAAQQEDAQAGAPVKVAGGVSLSSDLLQTLRGEYMRDFIRGLRGERSCPDSS